MTTPMISLSLLTLFFVSCGSSSNDNASESLNAAKLVDCSASDTGTSSKGASINIELNAASLDWTCDEYSITTFMQTNSLDYSQKNYKIDCTNPANSAHTISFWMIAPTSGQAFTIQTPWATKQPNLSAKVTIGDDVMEQDSFSIDSDNLDYISGIVWSNTDDVTMGNKTGRNLKGCMEAKFKKTSKKPSGSFLAVFNAVFE